MYSVNCFWIFHFVFRYQPHEGGGGNSSNAEKPTIAHYYLQIKKHGFYHLIYSVYWFKDHWRFLIVVNFFLFGCILPLQYWQSLRADLFLSIEIIHLFIFLLPSSSRLCDLKILKSCLTYLFHVLFIILKFHIY